MYVSINECLNEDNGTGKGETLTRGIHHWDWGFFLFTFIDKILMDRTQNSFKMKVQ